MKIKQLMGELWTSTPGKLGLVLLGILGLVSVGVVLTYPANFGSARWANPTYWADNPRSSPPAWTRFFSATRRAKHRIMDLSEPARVTADGRVHEQVFEATVDWQADEPPSFLSVSVSDVTYQLRPPVVTIVLVRPDGGEVTLHRYVVSGPRRNEEAPYIRHDVEPRRIVLGSDERVTDEILGIYAAQYSWEPEREVISDDVERALFGRPAGGAEADPVVVLKGEYRVEVRVLTANEKDTVGGVRVVLGGTVFGVMGTDALGRDLAIGLLFGLPVALLIGVATSTLSTLLGMTLGLLSGYAGGWTDTLIQRAADVVANVPVLPLLIFLVFIGGSKLWLILLVLVAFSWPGLTIVVRSMVLQLRSGQEVEAARTLGASRTRIMYRHVLPHVASYILAQLVFFAPSDILAEAGLSFLGLGDPSIPTWGQILEYGFRTGAVFLGYWWWIIPPGALIVVTAMTFMFLALGLEPVVDPRLRGRRTWRI